MLGPKENWGMFAPSWLLLWIACITILAATLPFVLKRKAKRKFRGALQDQDPTAPSLETLGSGEYIFGTTFSNEFDIPNAEYIYNGYCQIRMTSPTTSFVEYSILQKDGTNGPLQKITTNPSYMASACAISNDATVVGVCLQDTVSFEYGVLFRYTQSNSTFQTLLPNAKGTRAGDLLISSMAIIRDVCYVCMCKQGTLTFWILYRDVNYPTLWQLGPNLQFPTPIPGLRFLNARANLSGIDTIAYSVTVMDDTIGQAYHCDLSRFGAIGGLQLLGNFNTLDVVSLFGFSAIWYMTAVSSGSTLYPRFTFGAADQRPDGRIEYDTLKDSGQLYSSYTSSNVQAAYRIASDGQSDILGCFYLGNASLNRNGLLTIMQLPDYSTDPTVSIIRAFDLGSVFVDGNLQTVLSTNLGQMIIFGCGRRVDGVSIRFRYALPLA